MPRTLSQTELETFPSYEWPEIAARLTSAVREALEIALSSQDGAALSREQCLLLANCDGDDLLGLLVAANELRAELAGNLVTYVVNRNINFTNICFVGCKFCAFSRGPREEDTYFLSFEQMTRKAVEAWELGATEVCIQGGLPHGLPPYYYRDILRAVKSAVPRMHCHAFSPMEIVYGVELTGSQGLQGAGGQDHRGVPSRDAVSGWLRVLHEHGAEGRRERREGARRR